MRKPISVASLLVSIGRLRRPFCFFLRLRGPLLRWQFAIQLGGASVFELIQNGLQAFGARERIARESINLCSTLFADVPLEIVELTTAIQLVALVKRKLPHGVVVALPR